MPQCVDWNCHLVFYFYVSIWCAFSGGIHPYSEALDRLTDFTGNNLEEPDWKRQWKVSHWLEPPLNFPWIECYVDSPGVPFFCFENEDKIFFAVYSIGFFQFQNHWSIFSGLIVQFVFGEFSPFQAKLLEDQRRSLKHFENVQSGLSIWAEEHLTSQTLVWSVHFLLRKNGSRANPGQVWREVCLIVKVVDI